MDQSDIWAALLSPEKPLVTVPVTPLGPPYTNEQIEALLRDEIEWVVTEGPGWDPLSGAVHHHCEWISLSQGSCGTCAIGALVIHQQPEDKYNGDDVGSAAELLGRSHAWAHTLYLSVADSPTRKRKYPDAYLQSAVEMGVRLRLFGDQLMREKMREDLLKGATR